MEIAGTIALVTGGARRVGRALSLGLAHEGADVVVNYRRSADDAADVVREIELLGRRAIAVRADIGSRADRDALIEQTRAAFGRLDILVNNASVFERTPFTEITETDWDRVLTTNLKAPFFLSQAALPLLRERGGAIINIADLSALQAWPSFAHHAVSKAGLVHLTRVLARALGPTIRVNCIVAGTVLPPEPDQGQDRPDGSERRMVRRAGSPFDVVDAMLFLLRSEFVTGACLVVDGGRTLL
jgi:NAD(P)-dependent dehydrogenase (short-subunit alcohol dehydrogenase family)